MPDKNNDELIDWEDEENGEPEYFAWECEGCMVTQDHPGQCDICGNPTDGMEF